MRATALLIVCALICTAIAGVRGEWDGVSLLALIFMGWALIVASVERRKR